MAIQPTKNSVDVLVISGSVGSGKSSVAEAMSERLNNNGIAHAVIDMDYLRYAFPRPKDDPFHRKLATKNLAAIAANYVEAGLTRFIIPNVVEHKADVNDIRISIPGSNILIARLKASLDTLHKRLRQRETGETLNWHLNRAVELTKQLESTKVEDIVIEVDDKPVSEIADELIARWLG